MNRRRWYLLINTPIALWAVATIIVVSVHRFFTAGGWLMVHLLLLGAVSAAILVWSQHFADAVLRRQAPGGRVSHGLRILGHTIGASFVVAGIVVPEWRLVLVGGSVVGAVALWHAASLMVQLRGALPARFSPLVKFYVLAALLLIVGVTLGIIMARADLSVQWHDQLYAAHIAANLLGWVGLTVVGTVVLLWPTVLHARIADSSGGATRTAMWLMFGGVLLVGTAAILDVRAIIAVGVALYVAGLITIGVEGWRQARQAPPSTFAAWSMAAAYGWFVGCTIAFGVLLTIAPTWADAAGSVQGLITPFAGGFAAQIVIAALSYLLPVVLGGGPEVSRRTAVPLETGALFRVLVVNAGGLIYVLPVPSLVRVVVSMVVFVVLASFLLFATQAILAVREPKAAKPTATSKTERPVRQRTTTGAVTAAATVLVLAVTSGIMLDPASAGIGSVHADEGVATGNTTTVDVIMRDTRFLPDVIEVPAGDVLVINLTNEDAMDHDLTVENGFTSGRIHAGETVTVEVGLITSTLDAWCSIAGHRLLGMVMTIIAVGADGEPHVGASSPPGEAGHAGHDGHGSQTGEPSAAYDPMAPAEPGFEATDASLPPASGNLHQHTFVVQEAVREVAPGVTQRLWTFGGTAPGPTLRGKVGDRFEITLVNDGTVGHSIDFHAGALAPDEPMRTIQPGESLTYNFTATRSGIWMYHCATMPMSLHIANGMFGAVIIDPPDLPEVDKEFLLVQSEFYLGPQGGEPTMERITTQHPDMVAFNGYGNQYVFDPLEARVGETVRVWVLDVGPNRPASFHVVGGQFDTVFFEGDYQLRDGGSTGTGGSQALALQPAQGGFVELVFPEAGHYPFVSHIMSDAEKGASGIFRITD